MSDSCESSAKGKVNQTNNRKSVCLEVKAKMG